jgi:hypothetical protein
MIDSLRQELSLKSKKALELQFESEEMKKMKKRSVEEVDELY